MKRIRSYSVCFVLACWVALFFVPAVLGAEEECGACHADLAGKPVKHQALGMGCAACHTALDTTSVPHRSTGAVAKGLSGLQPELCYGCHDRSSFAKKNVHAAALIGCTSCHDPHSSKNRKLLKAAVPDVCFSCHDRSLFRKKYRHGPVEAGLCLTCHLPHASDEKVALLVKRPVEVCLSCHRSVTEQRHLVAGFGGGHPIGLPQTGKKWKKLKDPLRPGKPFSCASCHDPHSADNRFMIRFAAASPMETCRYCHAKYSPTSHLR